MEFIASEVTQCHIPTRNMALAVAWRPPHLGHARRHVPQGRGSRRYAPMTQQQLLRTGQVEEECRGGPRRCRCEVGKAEEGDEGVIVILG